MTTIPAPTDTPPIRVALVITELNVGGAERCLTQLASGLDRRYFDPRVISLAPQPVSSQRQLVDQLAAAQVPVQYLNASSKWQVVLAVRRLRKSLLEFQPQVVQSFLFHADVVTRLARRGDRWRAFLGLRVADPSRRRQRLERWAAKLASGVVCVSDAVRDYARDTVGIPPEKLSVIPNAIDVEKYRTVQPLDLRALGVPASQRVLLCVGRLHHQKGLDWLLGTLPTLFQQLPTHDLVIVGAGPEEARLRAQANKLRVDHRVHFLGWRDDVPRLMAAAAQLVLPSRWEGMANVVLEAMATGLPVVASKTHGVEELLGPHRDAQTVAFGDDQGLIDRVVAFARDNDLAGRIGAANQARVAAEFSLKAMVAAYQSLYLGD